MHPWTEHWSSYGHRATASEIRELLKLLDRPGIISFAGGIPDPRVFPRASLQDAFATVLADPARAGTALQYSVSEGHQGLRAKLAAMMTARDMPCAAENILITSGSQQGLYLSAALLVSPGQTILTHRPTYLGALHGFEACAPRYAVLPRISAEGPADASARLGYVMPDFANPDGRSLTLEERQHLLEVTAQSGLPLVEDAAYAELGYDGPTPPSLLALDITQGGHIEATRVIHCGTFSKTVVPGLRLGWVVAATPVIHKLVLLKQACDLHSCSLTQTVMLEVLETLPADHLPQLRALYRGRRDTMLAALAEHMPPSAAWTRPGGGMFIWVTLPEGFDGATLLQRSIDETEVAFVPGSAFFPDRASSNTLRLSFSRTDEAMIEQGIARLGALVRRLDNARGVG